MTNQSRDGEVHWHKALDATLEGALAYDCPALVEVVTDSGPV